MPSTGTSGSCVTSPASASTRWRARTRTAAPGSAAASATPAAIPIDVSIIELTTAGTPAASATSSAARTPPSGCCLSTITSAASSARESARVVERADALVGRDRHVDAPPHRGEVVERRDRLLDVLEVVAARARVIIVTAVSTSHAPLASTRTATSGPDRVAHRGDERDARPRRAPSPSPPGSRGASCTENGPVDQRVHRHVVAHRGREAVVAASSAARRHAAGSLG